MDALTVFGLVETIWAGVALRRWMGAAGIGRT